MADGDFPKHIGKHSPEASHIHHYSHIIKKGPLNERIDSSFIDWHKIFRGIRRHFLLVFFSAVSGAVCILTITLCLHRTYTAQAYVLYREENGPAKTLIGNYTLNKLSLPTMLEMMKLPVHFKSVKTELGIDSSIDDLISRTTIENPPGLSNLIRILVTGKNAAFTVDLANTLAKAVVKHSEDLSRRQLQEAMDYFSAQRDHVEQKLIQNSKAIADFNLQNPSFELDSGNSNLIESATHAYTTYQNAALSYNSLLVEYENLQKEIANVPEHNVNILGSAPIKDQLIQTELALIDARTKYAQENPKIKVLESSLRELRNLAHEKTFEQFQEKNSLKDQLGVEAIRLQGKMLSAQKLKDDLEIAVKSIEKELENLPAEQMLFAKMVREKKSAEEEIKELDWALRATQLYMSLGKGDLELYQAADTAVPLTSKWDSWLVLFPLFGAFFGFSIGFAIAACLELSDRHFCTAKQIDSRYNVKCIQTIPEISALLKKDAEEKTLFYIRDLVDQFECLNNGKTPTSIGFTSSLNGEGKSCLAYYLAKYYAVRLRKKTVVVEFDYHKNEFLRNNLTSCETLEKYLRNETDLSHIVDAGEPDCIKTAFDPAMKELLKSERMTQLWNNLKEKYEVIVIDTPAIVEDDYALNLVRWVDLCIFVIGSSIAKREHVDASFRELERRGIMPGGIVLNRVPLTYIDDVRICAEQKHHEI